MKAVLYCRSATENPTWLDDQEADCQKYARENGLTITQVVTDIGHARAGIDRVLEAVEHDGADAVIVNDLARLGSKLTDHIATVRRLNDAGVTLHVAKERFTDARFPLLLGVMQAYAEADDRLVGHPVGDG